MSLIRLLASKADLERSIVNALSLLETVNTIQDIEIEEAK